MQDWIGILGGGAWGTALALTLCRTGALVRLWVREAETAAHINAQRENPSYLPGIPLPEGLSAVTDPGACLGGRLLLLAVPAQYLRPVMARVLAQTEGAALPPLVLCCKGIECDDGQGRSGALMSEVIADLIPEAMVAILSGPTFAREVALEQPTAVTLACDDPLIGESIMSMIGSKRFRPYLSDDVIGAQIGGAVKNVMAIACGIVSGCGLGDNARAALITRGMAEIARLGEAKGGRRETLLGLSGLGDLTLTCTSPQSRNYSLGMALGRGESLQDILDTRHSIAEGVATAQAVTALADRLGVDMPLSEAVHGILAQNRPIAETIETLLARPFRRELIDL